MFIVDNMGALPMYVASLFLLAWLPGNGFVNKFLNASICQKMDLFVLLQMCVYLLVVILVCLLLIRSDVEYMKF